jgi:hypothetical protein
MRKGGFGTCLLSQCATKIKISDRRIIEWREEKEEVLGLVLKEGIKFIALAYQSDSLGGVTHRGE